MLKELRNKTGMNQVQASIEIGVSLSTLVRWENGITIPTIDQVPSIRKAYNLTDAEVLALFEREAS